MKHPFKAFSNPESQVKFHTVMSYFWLVAMAIVPFFKTFQGASNLPALLIMEVSLYANFATEFGSISAAQSSLNTSEININSESVTINK